MRTIATAIARTLAFLFVYVRGNRHSRDYRRARDYQDDFGKSHNPYAFLRVSIPLFFITITVVTAAITAAQINALHQAVPMVYIIADTI